MQPHQVNGQSMIPNFESGDYVLTDKISYRLGEPQRGDVVVFHAPSSAHCPQGTGCDFIKRVVGLPGELVEIKDSQIFVNSKPLGEVYIPDEFQTEAGSFTRNKSVSLGDNQYFVAGDNRPHSSDSRVWGPIDKSMIVGKAFFRYWPPETMGVIESIRY
jgi:signal peptidase I